MEGKVLKYISFVGKNGQDGVVVNTDAIRYAKLTKNNLVITLQGEFPTKVNENTGRTYTDGEIWLPKDERILEFLGSEESTLKL